MPREIGGYTLTEKEVLESWKATINPKDEIEKEAEYIIREALEKQIPNSRTSFTLHDSGYVECGNCYSDCELFNGNYCPVCGQKLIDDN